MGEEHITERWKLKYLKVLRLSSRDVIERYFEKRRKAKELLCEHFGLAKSEIEKLVTNTNELICVLSTRDDLALTVSDLIEALKRYEHYELIETLQPLLVKDVEADEKRLAHVKLGSSKMGMKSTSRQNSDGCLTVHDVRRDGVLKFDTIVCRSENPRSERINERLRNCGLKVCDLRRDLLPGVATYPAESVIIEHRAPTLLLMLDQKMLDDQECSFQMIQAQWLDPDARFGKWIPVKLEVDIEIPSFIQHGQSLDLSTDEKLEENWGMLLSSIKGSDQRTENVEDLAQQLNSLTTSNI